MKNWNMSRVTRNVTRIAVGLVIIFTIEAHRVAFAGPGHSHGEENEPKMGLEEMAPRATAVGEVFQMVAMVSEEGLAVFLDHTESNQPAEGIMLEVMAGDASVPAKEITRGLYRVAPWPPFMENGVMAFDDQEAIDIVVLALSDNGEDLLTAKLNSSGGDNHSGHDHMSHDNGNEAETKAIPASAKGPSMTNKELASEAENWLALPFFAGAVSLLGGALGIRGRGTSKWVGFSVAGLGVLSMVAAFTIM